MASAVKRSEPVTGVLPNGLRWTHQEVASLAGHVGLIVRVGTRDEEPDEQGLAHFIEHLLFKGTKRRKAFHILSKIEDAGGELNAYTGKEDTTVYASFLTPQYANALDVLIDVVFHSVYPEKELEKEKEVISDEIDSYLDSPSELIFDDFEDLLFAGHSIGRNILGTKNSLQSFTREKVLAFVKKHYTPANMVLTSVGGISAKQFQKVLAKASERIPVKEGNFSPERLPVSPYKPTALRWDKDTHQCHTIVGGRAVSVHDHHLTGMVLLNNLLGGPAMNSRLNLNIRERYGIAYHIESFYSPYADTGAMGVYVGTDSDTMERSLRLVEKEFKKLREIPLGVVQLAKAKQQLLGQMALGQESNAHLMTALGRSLLMFDRIDTLEEVHAKVHALTAASLCSLAEWVYAPHALSYLIYEGK